MSEPRPLNVKALEASAQALAEAVVGAVVRRSDVTPDVARIHRELAEEAVRAYLDKLDDVAREKYEETFKDDPHNPPWEELEPWKRGAWRLEVTESL